MEVFLITAITADGFIAKDKNHAAFWTSRADKDRFVKLTKEAGVVIMGSKTFETIGKPLKDRLNIVYSKSKKYDNVLVTDKKPDELIKDLKNQGFQKVAVCGGASIYSLFMNSGIIDKLYITIEPKIFGKGINIFSGTTEKDMKLISLEKNKDSVFLEYEIIK